MEQLGVDQVFIDYTSGKNTQSPELQVMLDFIRQGGVVIVESIGHRVKRIASEVIKKGFLRNKYYFFNLLVFMAGHVYSHNYRGTCVASAFCSVVRKENVW